MPTLSDIKQQLGPLDPATRWTSVFALRQLPSILWQDEVAKKAYVAFEAGSPGLLVATDKRLIFVDKKLFGGTVEDFAYRRIVSVQYSADAMFGKLTVSTAAGDATFERIGRDYIASFARLIQEQVGNAPAA